MASLNSFVYDALLKSIQRGERAIIKSRYTHEGKDRGKIIGKRMIGLDEMNEREVEILKKGILEIDTNGKETIVFEPYYPKSRLLIFGGGHIALSLSHLAAMTSFEVTVVDDREFFANKNRFPDAARVICSDFESAFEDIYINSSTYIVVATRGHRHDYACLSRIIGKNFRFLGMVASKHRSDEIRKKLEGEGFAVDAVERLISPVGLNIGALTPSEIAVSIAGQIIEYKRTENGERCKYPEFESECHEILASGKHDDLVLATIIETKGSVPREVGAKMIVFPDGKIAGSIGGGSGEAKIVEMAKEHMAYGGYSTGTVDMTGRIAEEDGMVCGGTMKVLLEKL